MMHALDTDGQLYTRTGMFNRWWTEDSWTQFNNKVEDIVKQYSQYELFDNSVSNTYIYLYILCMI